MEIHNMPQNTPEWLEARLGKITGSEVSCLFVKGKAEHGWGAGAITYAHRLASERITGKLRASLQNQYTDWGDEYEPVAIEEYELRTFNLVDRVGFVELNPRVGCSPDGLVDDDGIIEVKCPEKPEEYMRMKMGGDIPKDYMHQVQFNLWVTDREWCDLIYYHPYFPGKSGIHIQRIERGKDIPFLATVASFNKFIEELTNKFSKL